jgi:hypothetical protein
MPQQERGFSAATPHSRTESGQFHWKGIHDRWDPRFNSFRLSTRDVVEVGLGTLREP